MTLKCRIRTGGRLLYINADSINDFAFLTWFEMIFVNFAAEKLAKRHFLCV